MEKEEGWSSVAKSTGSGRLCYDWDSLHISWAETYGVHDQGEEHEQESMDKKVLKAWQKLTKTGG